MISKTKNVLLVSLVAVGILAGCVAVPSIGAKQADVPPRIVTDPTDQTKKAWDNPGAFGPVPAALAAKGQAVCASLDTKDMHFKAIGYHAHAKDFEGKPFPSGGYYCVAK